MSRAGPGQRCIGLCRNGRYLPMWDIFWRPCGAGNAGGYSRIRHAGGVFATGIGELYKEKAETAMDGACCFLNPAHLYHRRPGDGGPGGGQFWRQKHRCHSDDGRYGKDLGAGVKMACEKLDLPCEIFQIRADAWDADRAAEGIKARQPDFVIGLAQRQRAGGLSVRWRPIM